MRLHVLLLLFFVPFAPMVWAQDFSIYQLDKKNLSSFMGDNNGSYVYYSTGTNRLYVASLTGSRDTLFPIRLKERAALDSYISTTGFNFENLRPKVILYDSVNYIVFNQSGRYRPDTTYDYGFLSKYARLIRPGSTLKNFIDGPDFTSRSLLSMKHTKFHYFLFGVSDSIIKFNPGEDSVLGKAVNWNILRLNTYSNFGVIKNNVYVSKGWSYRVYDKDIKFINEKTLKVIDTLNFAKTSFLHSNRDTFVLAQKLISNHSRIYKLSGDTVLPFVFPGRTVQDTIFHDFCLLDSSGTFWFSEKDRKTIIAVRKNRIDTIRPFPQSVLVGFSGLALIDDINQKWFGTRASGVILINDIHPRMLVSDTVVKACTSQPVIFSDSSSTSGDGLFKWKWYFGDGDSATGKTASHVYVNPGTYLARLWVKDSNSSENWVTKKIVVQPGSVVRFTQSDDTLNTCGPVLLKPQALLWSNPVWFTPAGQVAGVLQLTASQSGLYIIQNEAENCASRDSVYVRILGSSPVQLNLPDTVTSCREVLLNPSSPVWQNPVWQTPSGPVANQTSLTASVSGRYVIENNFSGCSSKDSVFIIRKSPIAISFSNQPDTLFTCKSVLLSPVAQPFINPVWETPSGVFANINTFNASLSGNYKVTNDIGNCANSDSIYIAFRDTSTISFVLRSGGAEVTDFNLTLKENQLPYLADAITQTQAVRYRWFLNGQLQNGNSFTQGLRFSNPGSYTVTLITTSADSCVGKAQNTWSLTQRVLPPLEIPNLVTQNGDFKNDYFKIEQLPLYSTHELIIYNRWGKEVFRASPYLNNWPPPSHPPGTYFYRLTAEGKTHQGWIEVLQE